MKKTRILVIDDESSIIKFLKVNLERNGYEVFTCMNGEDGVRIFQNELPDLVILDIIMPDMDGFSVCQ
ncbi:MAG: response regulator, partial [Chitinispirillaceae bacterium]|nr:response regulator [Chitinispirillaceae bacterium]